MSAQTGQGLEALGARLRGKTTCFAGQSAVGKSSLLNALSPQMGLETGGLSKKTDRGRHTTRHSELYYLKEVEGIAVDTPGFSVLACMEMEPEALAGFYPEFTEKACRFPGCLHHKEPDCCVVKDVKAGEIAKGRYERYLQLLEELKKRRDEYYD